MTTTRIDEAFAKLEQARADGQKPEELEWVISANIVADLRVEDFLCHRHEVNAIDRLMGIPVRYAPAGDQFELVNTSKENHQ